MNGAGVHDLLEKNVRERGEQAAVFDGERSVTYAELGRRSQALAAFLSASGARRGDRIAIQMVKSVEEVVAIFAVARLGAVFVDVDPQRTPSQAAHAIRDSGARWLLADERLHARLLRAGLPACLEGVVVRGRPPPGTSATPWDEIPDGEIAAAPVDDLDPAAILYTSGSTGQPKGVVLTHRNLVEGAQTVAGYLSLSPADRLLSVLSFGFDYGLNQLTTAFLVGASIVLQAVAIPAEIIRTARATGCTGFAAVPPLWIPILRYLELDGVEPWPLRYVTNSGGAIPTAALREMPRRLPGAEIFLMYGLTEAFRSTFLAPDRFADKMGSIGKAIPGVEVFVIDDQRIAGPGQEGELVHRGELITAGYWNQPEATAEKIRACPALAAIIGDEKVCYSGDRVVADQEGFLWFRGRTDAMIKCGGHRVSPTEIEDVVHESALVDDVVAFGVSDELQGQVVHVAIAWRAGTEGDRGVLDRFCRKNLPTYMVPRRVHVPGGALARNANGKLDRPAILAWCGSRAAKFEGG